MSSRVTTDLDRAADVLRRGGLVAFPTETVYGLGAHARQAEAVARIFAAKGRPADHPLIVHLADQEQLSSWALEVPEVAQRLADAFWPGPLTLILKRAPGVLDAVTGGQSTVGLRVPRHPVARQLLQRVGEGVAAPSANRFGRVSPTRAQHVLEELGSRVDLILEGGDCEVGLESTIVDCSRGRPMILRPGGVTREMIEGVLGDVLGDVLGEVVDQEGPSDVRAPGSLPSHYAPRAQVLLTSEQEVLARARQLVAAGKRVGVLAAQRLELPSDVEDLLLPVEPEAAARHLYERLREADVRGIDVVLAILPPGIGVGLAIVDRLERAAASRPMNDAR